MSYQSIDTNRFHWRWRELGNGPRLLLAFPGFNRSPDDLLPFAKHLNSRFTILAFELFFHGKSVVIGDDFSQEELREAIEMVLRHYGGISFEVMGHSFGGRLALNCVEMMGDKIQGLYLLAPDAMRFNPGFWFATQTIIGRSVMRYYKNNPRPVISMMHLLPKLRLYSKKAMEFYISQISFPPMLDKVYKVWMAHRKTVVNLKKVSEAVKKHHIQTILFLGKYDTIISNRSAQQFVRLCGSDATLIFLESGHRLYEKHGEISEIILSATEKCEN